MQINTACLRVVNTILHTPLHYCVLFITPSTMKAPTVRFVSIIAVDPFRDEVLLVKKTKGPKHLHGKITFPGGKIEEDDPSAAHAASRELLEEAGVEVPPFDLIHLTKRSNQEFSLDIFVAITNLNDAEPQAGEEEPVFKASLAETRLKSSQKNPDYVEDTSDLLEALYTVRQINRRLASVSLRSNPQKESPLPQRP